MLTWSLPVMIELTRGTTQSDVVETSLPSMRCCQASFRFSDKLNISSSSAIGTLHNWPHGSKSILKVVLKRITIKVRNNTMANIYPETCSSFRILLTILSLRWVDPGSLHRETSLLAGFHL